MRNCGSIFDRVRQKNVYPFSKLLDVHGASEKTDQAASGVRKRFKGSGDAPEGAEAAATQRGTVQQNVLRGVGLFAADPA